VPSELRALLNSNEGTRHMQVLSGTTEHETLLPFSNRGPRCHDLCLRAKQGDCEVIICIEAKADEPFGGTVAEELDMALRRPATRFPERLEWLVQSLLGLSAFSDENHRLLSESISELPYQLFAAVAGTLLEARLPRAGKAVFVVHEFRTSLTADTKLALNAKALNNFTCLLGAANECTQKPADLIPGQMIGPISIIDRPVPGTLRIPCEIPLFIGKVRTDRAN